MHIIFDLSLDHHSCYFLSLTKEQSQTTLGQKQSLEPSLTLPLKRCYEGPTSPRLAPTSFILLSQPRCLKPGPQPHALLLTSHLPPRGVSPAARCPTTGGLATGLREAQEALGEGGLCWAPGSTGSLVVSCL